MNTKRELIAKIFAIISIVSIPLGAICLTIFFKPEAPTWAVTTVGSIGVVGCVLSLVIVPKESEASAPWASIATAFYGLIMVLSPILH